MERSEVVASVAGDLHATEQAIDAAITQATTLVQSMIGARAALSVSPIAGTVAQAKAMETIAALGVAREAIVASHGELTKDHRRLGFGTFAVGPLNKPDEIPPGIEAAPVETARRLRAI
ncbi:hypothetical protein BH10PSE2_BH10PSE2_11450 [soil metagenome]